MCSLKYMCCIVFVFCCCHSSIHTPSSLSNFVPHFHPSTLPIFLQIHQFTNPPSHLHILVPIHQLFLISLPLLIHLSLHHLPPPQNFHVPVFILMHNYISSGCTNSCGLGAPRRLRPAAPVPYYERVRC